MQPSPFVVGTRWYDNRSEQKEQALTKLGGFITSMREAGAEHIYVAVNVAEDKVGTLQQEWPEYTTVFPVQPWGFFVNPLNSILLTARPHLATHKLLIASGEIRITPASIQKLIELLDPTTLVAGAALMGHEYAPGTHENANGRQVPWNTLALYNPYPLWVTGIPLLGDGPISEPENKGVEELMTFTILQRLYPGLKVFLTQIEGQEWNTSGFDGERLVAHQKKMASKSTRPARQLEFSNLKTGPTVIHI